MVSWRRRDSVQRRKAGLIAREVRKICSESVSDQFGHCSITLGLEFSVLHEGPRETPVATPLQSSPADNFPESLSRDIGRSPRARSSPPGRSSKPDYPLQVSSRPRQVPKRNVDRLFCGQRPFPIDSGSACRRRCGSRQAGWRGLHQVLKQGSRFLVRERLEQTFRHQ